MQIDGSMHPPGPPASPPGYKRTNNQREREREREREKSGRNPCSPEGRESKYRRNSGEERKENKKARTIGLSFLPLFKNKTGRSAPMQACKHKFLLKKTNSGMHITIKFRRSTEFMQRTYSSSKRRRNLEGSLKNHYLRG